MKIFFVLILCIFSLLSCNDLDNSTSYEHWDLIQDRNDKRLKDNAVDFENVESRNDLIVYMFTSDDVEFFNNIKKEVNIFDLKTNHDPALLFAYLLVLFSDLNIDLFNTCKNISFILQKYESLEKNNSFFSYLLSYCYLKENEYQKSLVTLSKANKRDRLNYYHDKNKKVVYDYYLKKTQDEIVSYQSTISVLFSSFHFLLYELSKEYEVSKDNFSIEEFHQIRRELYKMGIIMDKYGSTVADKKISIAVQREFLEKNDDLKLPSKLNSELENLSYLTKRLKSKRGEGEYLKYLVDLYNYGEYKALRNLR